MAPIQLQDLNRPLSDVARETPEWLAEDHAGAVAETLAAAGRQLHSRSYVFWLWVGSTIEGVPALVTAIHAGDAEAFRPKGPASALARAVSAAVWAGADPRELVVFEWRGFSCISDAHLDRELAAEAQIEVHESPARVSVAQLPDGVALAGPPLSLGRAPEAYPTPIARLAMQAGVHPVRAAAALAELGIPDEEVHGFSPELVAALLGAAPDPEAIELQQEAPPSLDIEDDFCPRRRHARRLLRRLLGMKKVGAGYHTAFDHIYRGAPADARHEALEVGEALIRAGLLGEKPSVGQRHVYLRREALPQIHALIERGETDDPGLLALWTAPPPGSGSGHPRESQPSP